MLKAPGTIEGHLLGTDELGRDILSRLVYGARISIGIGVTVVIAAFFIGVPLGIVSGYYGGKMDFMLMRIMDVLMAFPQLLLCILFVAVLGANLTNAVMAVSIYTVPNFARMARSETLAIKNGEYIEAAKALGANNFRIIVSHILPKHHVAFNCSGYFEFRKCSFDYVRNGVFGNRCPASHTGMGCNAVQRTSISVGGPSCDQYHWFGNSFPGIGPQPVW